VRYKVALETLRVWQISTIGVSLLVEILGNTTLFPGESFGSAAYSSSFSGSTQSCVGSFPDQVSLKLRKSTKDIKD
jgi:hypothetical protein